jgi:hypothetical protein
VQADLNLLLRSLVGCLQKQRAACKVGRVCRHARPHLGAAPLPGSDRSSLHVCSVCHNIGTELRCSRGATCHLGNDCGSGMGPNSISSPSGCGSCLRTARACLKFNHMFYALHVAGSAGTLVACIRDGRAWDGGAQLAAIYRLVPNLLAWLRQRRDPCSPSRAMHRGSGRATGFPRSRSLSGR